jgi:glutathione synthase/RimK-type ligase-like ATP-grasp enzyme
MKDPVCWGIYRELAHSPGRETDDAEILRETAAELSRRGYSVGLKSPDELPETDAADVPPFLFVMCERVPIVERLAEWERRGARIVNRPSGIRNTDRERAVELFERDGIPFPRSVLVETAPARRTAFSGPCWIKRSDVHATEAGDVAFAAHPAELAAGLATLAARGIARAVVQEHVPGDLVKFYGVAGLGEEDGRPSWFQWFYHRDQTLSGHPLDPDALVAAATKAAAALRLDVYGGDAIVSAGGRITIIDVNAWPSFALFRAVAAENIAALLAARFARVGVPR